MQKRRDSLITAYTTLFTVAIGVVCADLLPQGSADVPDLAQSPVAISTLPTPSTARSHRSQMAPAPSNSGSLAEEKEEGTGTVRPNREGLPGRS